MKESKELLECSDLCSCVELAKQIPRDADSLLYDLVGDRLKEYSKECKSKGCPREEILINAGFQAGIDFTLNYTLYYFIYKILKEAKNEIIGKCVSRATYYRILNRLKWLEGEETLPHIKALVEELMSHLGRKRGNRVSGR